MNQLSVKAFDFRDIGITEFDDIYKKFNSNNIPLSGLPRIDTQGVMGDDFAIFLRGNSTDTIQEALIPERHWALQLPLLSRNSINHYHAHPEGNKHSLLCLPSSELIWHIRTDSPALTLVVHSDALESLFCSAELESLANHVTRVQRRDLMSKELESIAQQLMLQVNACTRASTDNQTGLVDNRLREQVLRVFELILASPYEAPRISNKARILARALDYIRQHYAHDLHLNEIVNFAHTTTRNLQIVFKTQLGLTPMQYIQRYRLVKFHKGLGSYGTVTQAAVYSGLRHMGRLPDQYRKLFGENPGDYLTRIRVANEKNEG